MMPSRFTLLAALAGVALLAAPPAHAQDESPAPSSSVSLNPFIIILGGINAEGEVALNPDVSIGVAGTYLPSSASGFDAGEHYKSFDAKLRFYPQGRASNGFSVALMAGAIDYRIDLADARSSGATVGFEADYNWLLGKRQRFLVGSGLGLRRIISDNSGDNIHASVRFQIGYAFSR